MLRGMVGEYGCALPSGLFGCADLRTVAAAAVIDSRMAWSWCAVLAAIAFLLPNTQEIMHDYLDGIAWPGGAAKSGAKRLSFAFTPSWAVFAAGLATAGLISLPHPTSFLYFNF